MSDEDEQEAEEARVIESLAGCRIVRAEWSAGGFNGGLSLVLDDGRTVEVRAAGAQHHDCWVEVVDSSEEQQIG